MLSFLRKHLRRGDEGASAVEYGLLVAGIAVVVMLVVVTLGGTIKNQFTDTDQCLKDSTTCAKGVTP